MPIVVLQRVAINIDEKFNRLSRMQWSLWNQIPRHYVNILLINIWMGGQTHAVSLASHVPTHLLIHLSAHLCHHHQSHHPSLIHSFTPNSKLLFQQILLTLILLLYPELPSRSRDRTYHAFRFILYFLFVLCGGLSWLHVSFLLHVKYTLSYRIVLYVQASQTDDGIALT